MSMTELERRCVEICRVAGHTMVQPVSQYEALGLVRAILVGAGVADLAGALVEVRQWIDNWTPDFVQDDEWPDTAARIDAAIAKARA